jgi:hypothetical protein
MPGYAYYLQYILEDNSWRISVEISYLQSIVRTQRHNASSFTHKTCLMLSHCLCTAPLAAVTPPGAVTLCGRCTPALLGAAPSVQRTSGASCQLLSSV